MSTPAQPNYDRGFYYLPIGWILITISTVMIGIRLYSRMFLTRSIGSDDFTISIALVLALAGEVGDTLSVSHGLGRHENTISKHNYQQAQRWEFFDWVNVFIAIFFIRASIMLFVLRLLPPTKKWEQRTIFVCFFLNFAITIIATVSYGVTCRPFKANYYDVPGAKCASQDIIVITNQVNGILACLIDIATALIPQFLLWRVPMKWSTKWVLNIIFGLGLITAGMSIGRVATVNRGVWQTDSTWREMPTSTFSMVEEQGGLIFASAPAVRQFFAYRRRTGNFLPTRQRQEANTDFVSMRRRINFRDIFWYREPILEGGRVTNATPTFKASKFSTSHTHAQNDLERSPLDLWEGKVKGLFHSSAGSRNRNNNNNGGTTDSSRDDSLGGRTLRGFPSPRLPNALKRKISSFEMLKSTDSARNARVHHSAERGQGWPGLGSQTGGKDVARKYSAWGLASEAEASEGAPAAGPATKARGDSSASEAEKPLRSSQDISLAEMLAAGAGRDVQKPEASHQQSQATPRDALEAGDSRSEASFSGPAGS